MAITNRISLQGGEEVKRQLQDLGTTGENAARQIERATADATTKTTGFGSAIGNVIGNITGAGHAATEAAEGHNVLATSFRTLTGAAGESGHAFTSIISALGSVASGIGPVNIALGAIVAGFATLAIKGAEAAAQVQEGAYRVGTSAEQYQGLSFAFRQSGSSAEAFEKAMGKVLEAAGDAGEGAAKIEEANNKIQESNKSLGDSGEDLAEFIRKQNNSIYEETRTSRLNLSEEVRRINIGLQKELKNINDSADDGADGHERRLSAENKANEQIYEARRSSHLRLQEAERKAGLELEEFKYQQYRKSEQALRKYHEVLEAETDRAARGINEKSKKIANLGVLLTEGGKLRDTSEILKDIATKLSEIENPAERAAKAVEIFGRRIGVGLVEALGEGRKGLDEFINRAKDLNIIFSEEQLKIGKHLSDTIDLLLTVISRFFDNIGLAIAPGLDKIFTALAETFSKMIKPVTEAFKSLMDFLGPTIDDIVLLIKGEFDGIQTYWVKFTGYLLEVFGKTIGYIIKIIVEGVKSIYNGIKALLDQVNALTGSHFTPGDVVALAVAFEVLAKAIGIARVALLAFRTAGGPILKLLELIAFAIVILGPLIVENWPEIEKKLGEWQRAWKKFAQDNEETVKGIIRNIKYPFELVFDFVSNGITNIGDNLSKMGQGFSDTWSRVTGFVSDAISNIQNLISQAISNINDNLSRIGQGFADAWNNITSVASDVFNTIIQGFVSIGQFASNVATTIGQAFSSAWQWIVDAFNTVTQGIIDAFNSVVQFFSDTLSSITQGFADAWQFVVDGFNSLVEKISRGVQSILNFLNSVMDKARAVGNAIASAFGGGGGDTPAVAAAGGGLIHGPNGVDRVPARLTAGEYVMRVSAVRKYGVGWMEAVNRGMAPVGFNAGGLVPSRPHVNFAEGGLVAGGGGKVSVDLGINGQRFAMSSDRAQATKLVRFARGEKLRQAGLKPSWVD